MFYDDVLRSNLPSLSDNDFNGILLNVQAVIENSSELLIYISQNKSHYPVTVLSESRLKTTDAWEKNRTIEQYTV